MMRSVATRSCATLETLDPLLEVGAQAANRRRIATLYLRRERREEALRALEPALAAEPRDLESLEAIAGLQRAHGDTPQLLRTLWRCVELHDPRRRALCISEIATLLQEQGDLGAAIDTLLRLEGEETAPRDVPDRIEALLEQALGTAHESGLVSDATVALSERERELFWRLRESIPEAQRKDGASLKHDISVPVSQVPRFIERAGGWVAQHIPQGVLIAYGHLGDGNLHFNINQRAGTQVAQLQAVESKVKRAVHDFVQEFGGSFSAEHGIGQLKVFELERYANPVELELMRRVKQAFDPNGIMNPGKVLARS
jgi:FAD/FMN-containing dehydrogenase